jgi:hypothetical protein
MGIRRTPGNAKEVTRQEKRLREEKDFLEWEYFLFYRDEIEYLFTVNRVFCWGVICREAGAFLLLDSLDSLPAGTLMLLKFLF